jgi:hypothetical protein
MTTRAKLFFSLWGALLLVLGAGVVSYGAINYAPRESFDNLSLYQVQELMQQRGEVLIQDLDSCHSASFEGTAIYVESLTKLVSSVPQDAEGIHLYCGGPSNQYAEITHYGLPRSSLEDMVELCEGHPWFTLLYYLPATLLLPLPEAEL